MANRTKLTPDVQRRIVDAIRVGATYDLACKYGGISDQTLANWLAWGAAGRKPYVGFFVAVKDAEGAAAVKWLAQIDKAARDGTWQAAAWKLERRYPELYGRQVIEHHRREAVERIAAEEGVDPAQLYDFAFEREKRRAS